MLLLLLGFFFTVEASMRLSEVENTGVSCELARHKMLGVAI